MLSSVFLTFSLTWKLGYYKYFQNNYPYVPVIFLIVHTNLELVTFSWSDYSNGAECSRHSVHRAGGANLEQSNDLAEPNKYFIPVVCLLPSAFILSASKWEEKAKGWEGQESLNWDLTEALHPFTIQSTEPQFYSCYWYLDVVHIERKKKYLRRQPWSITAMRKKKKNPQQTILVSI